MCILYFLYTYHFVFYRYQPCTPSNPPLFSVGTVSVSKRRFLCACHRGIQASVRMPDGLSEEVQMESMEKKCCKKPFCKDPYESTIDVGEYTLLRILLTSYIGIMS